MINLLKNSDIDRLKKLILIIIIIVFVFSLIPLFWISIYNHPQADDYSTSVETHRAFTESGSVFKTIKAGALRTYDSYMTWHGGYASIFLTTLQPGIFGQKYYSLTAFIMLFALIFSTLFVTKKILVDLFKLDIVSYLIVSLMILLISIQFPSKAVSSFYWFNGATMYSLAYSFSLILFGLVVNIVITEKKRVRISGLIISILLSIVIAGGNIMISFSTALILFSIIFFLAVKKSKKIWIVTPIFLVYMICFAINIIAPGNAARQATLDTLSPFATILQAVRLGIEFSTDIGINSIAPTLSIYCFSLAVLPFLSKIIKNPKYEFKKPLLVLLVSFGMFCAILTPAIYVLGWLGPWRARNIYFFYFVFWIILNAVYICGWINKNLQALNKERQISLLNLLGKKKSNIVAGWFFGLTIFGCLLFSNDMTSFYKISSISATQSLLSGEAQSYHNQYQARIEVLNSNQKDIQFYPFENQPYLLFFEDLRPYSTEWQNIGVADYYNKDSVIVISE